MSDWAQFEYEMTELVKAFGYDAVTTPPTGDFGVDVIAQNARRRVVVQCKLYGRGKIGADAVMKLLGSRAYFDANEAICITTSGFTKQAYQVAESKDIKLIDRDKLILLCRERSITIPSLTVLAAGYEAYPLSLDEVIVGRQPSSHIVVNSPCVSRCHAVLRRNGLRLSIQDCGSTNGTAVNGVAIQAAVTLNYGDRLSLGGFGLLVAMMTPVGDLVV